MLPGATLAQVKLSIQAKGYGTDTDTAQTEMVNSVYRRVLALRRWTFLENQVTLTTTAGVKGVTLSTADLLSINSVRLEIGSEYDDIDWLPTEELRDLYHTQRQPGVPQYWTKWDDQLEFWPVPDRAYTADINYTGFPPALVSGSDVLAIPRGYEDVIVWGAVIDMAYRQRDWNAYNAAKSEYRDRLTEMVGQYGNEQVQTSREVTRWAGWNDVGLAY